MIEVNQPSSDLARPSRLSCNLQRPVAGSFPKRLRITTDQIELLRHDNVVSECSEG